MLRGKKVYIRTIRRSDRDYMLKWFNDPEITENLSSYLPMTEMAEEKWIEKESSPGPGTDIHLIFDAIDGEAVKTIGVIGLQRFNWKDARAEFGIAIGEKDYWHQGYGTEAMQLIIRYGFEQLNLHRVLSKVYDSNERSIRLHTKCGFTEEGRIREYAFKNGAYHDCLLFGLLRRDWEKTQEGHHAER